MALNMSQANESEPEQTHSDSPVVWHHSDFDDLSCNSSDAYRVQGYSAWISLTLLLLFCLLGILVHLALLLAFKLKQSTHKLYYGLYITLSVVDFAFCILWLLLEGIVLVSGLIPALLPYQLCYLHGAIFAMGSSAVIVALFFTILHRICVIQKRSNSVIYIIVLTGIIATFVLPLLFTFAFTVDYGVSIPYNVCVHTCVTYAQTRTHQAVAVFMTVGVSILYLALLLCTLVLLMQLWALGCELRKEKMGLRRKRHSLQKLTMDSSELMDSGQDSGMSHSSHRGVADSNNSGRAKVMFVQPNTNSNNDDTDDSFDMQMRAKLTQTAGRRHTVANIGDNPLRQMRRGSYNEIGGGKANNYNYIRKWSVDITALQDQLENPRNFREITFLKERGEPAAVEEEVPLACPPPEKKEVKKPKKKVNMQESVDTIQIMPSIPAIVVDGNTPQHEETETEEELETERQRQHVAGLRRQLCTAGICVAMALLTALGFLPYYLVLLLPRPPSLLLAVNAGPITAALCTLPLLLHPLLLACMEKKVQQAFSKLHYNLQHCKCICYCNLASRAWKPAMTQTDNGL